MDDSSSSPFLAGSLSADLLLLGVALVLSAFFSASETALTALSEHRARALMEGKPKRNRSLKLWLDRPNQVLTTILIGNNVVNTFAAALATMVAQAVFAEAALSIAVGVTTIAILMVGEITPKTFAKHNAEKIAPFAMDVIAFLRFWLVWLVVPFTWMSRGLVKVFGGEVTRSGPFVTEEDLTYFLKVAQQEGVIEQHEGELMHSALDFAETVVREVMVPRTEISAIKASATLEEVLAEVKASGHTRLPVYGDGLDDIRGIFHTKELLSQLDHENTVKFQLKKTMIRPYFVPELMKIAELLKEFQRRRIHMAVVVDEYGGTSGIVCLEDIIEEIVGEIHDEYDDEEEQDIRRIDDNRWVADGKASIYDVAEALGFEAPDDGGYETLGGFLIAQAGKMPPVGDRLEAFGWMFTVTDADNRRVTRVEIVRLTPTDSGKIRLPELTTEAAARLSDDGASPAPEPAEDPAPQPAERAAVKPGQIVH